MIQRLVASVFLLGGMLSVACAGDTWYVGARFSSEQLLSADQIRHDQWHGLLQKYVDQAGGVRYRSWHQSQADQKALDAYLQSLSRMNPQLPARRENKLAFWINAYNAVTIRGILREYPTSSIRNHTARLFGYNIWDDLQLVVANRTYSLHQIEDDILRKMNEPRIHFAINCASKGCPRLVREAFEGPRLERLLQANTRHFLSRPENLRIEGSRAYLSSIFKWFAKDFGSTQQEQLEFIAEYAPAAQQKMLKTQVRSVAYQKYDWGLNEASTARNALRQ